MKESVSFRKTKDNEIDALTKDIMSSDLVNCGQLQNSECNVTTLVEQYNSVLTRIMDNHAPMQTKEVQVRPRPPWFNISILDIKAEA